MFPFLILAVILCQCKGTLTLDLNDLPKLAKQLQNLENDISSIKDDLEDRVTKLEDLAKIGTLRSCYEYSQYGLRTSGLYMIDPDGALIGQEPFQVLK